MSSGELAGLIQSVYDGVVRQQLAYRPMLPPLTEEQRARLDMLRDREMRRRESLMRDHLNEPGTTSICACGHVAYSTPGYLLHVYDVVAADVLGGVE